VCRPRARGAQRAPPPPQSRSRARGEIILHRGALSSARPLERGFGGGARGAAGGLSHESEMTSQYRHETPDRDDRTHQPDHNGGGALRRATRHDTTQQTMTFVQTAGGHRVSLPRGRLGGSVKSRSSSSSTSSRCLPYKHARSARRTVSTRRALPRTVRAPEARAIHRSAAARRRNGPRSPPLHDEKAVGRAEALGPARGGHMGGGRAPVPGLRLPSWYSPCRVASPASALGTSGRRLA
jgi:hypothetical protein